MTKVLITDHALVRWLERARGIDMEHLRRQLEEIAQPYADLRVKHVCVDGVWFVFDDERLVTVTPDKPPPMATLRHDRTELNGTTVSWTGKRHWKHKRRRGSK